ncbi:MAG: citrate synthase [Oligoflexia bacterium]|nr:citrate synthase [Oligoflexia bacterium]
MKNVTLTVNQKSYELPLVFGSEEECAVDITKLRSESGLITLDPGYANTGSCRSKITFLDGEKGILRYRGYPIEQLAEKSNFLEVSYLLIYGELPTKEQYHDFAKKIRSYSEIPKQMKEMINIFPKGAHPMAQLSSMLGVLSTFYPHLCDDNDKNSNEKNSNNKEDEIIALLLSQLRVLAAYIYRHDRELPLLEPLEHNCFCASFLTTMFGFDNNDNNTVIKKALDLTLILHADHEQNCSTSTVRMVGSSLASPFSAIVAGIHALWGAAHGGANQKVIEMLEQIESEGGDHRQFIKRAKDKNDSFKLMGFGHRVYKNFDPRAKIVKKTCDELLLELGHTDPLLEIAKELEKVALNDSYFIEKQLYPNVDFYSGIIYRALGIPTNMFTVMFALGRLSGWLAHWREMVHEGSKINRPRQIYVGTPLRSYQGGEIECAKVCSLHNLR